MPIISSNGQRIYGRHEQAPRPERKKKEQTEEEKLQEQEASDQEATNIIGLLKELGYFLLLIALITLAFAGRKNGLLSTGNSVMTSTEADTYVSYIQTAAQITTTPVEVIEKVNNNIPQSTDETTTTTTTTDTESTQQQEPIHEVYAHGPCGDIRSQAFLGGKVYATYSLKSVPFVPKVTENIPKSTESTTTTADSASSTSTSTETTTQQEQQILIEVTKPISFILKSIHEAIHTGSTLPLLHFMANEMCINQTKHVTFTIDSLQSLQSSSTTNTTLATTTTNDLLLTLFPTLTQGVKPNQLSTVQIPFTFSMTVTDVESKDILALKFNEEERQLLKQGDFSAFIRATLGQINPVFLLFGYVGLRFATLFINRRKVREFRNKQKQQQLAKENANKNDTTMNNNGDDNNNGDNNESTNTEIIETEVSTNNEIVQSDSKKED